MVVSSGYAIDLDEVPTGRDVTHVGLVSGGQDSTTAAAVSNEIIDLDILAYLDTGTGVNENEEYVRELGRHLGVQPWTLSTHESYEETVKEHGFPGPAQHGTMYIKLKERQIQKLAAVTGGELVLWTGVRSQESDRRMANVTGVQEGRRWTWVAPIHDWDKQQCTEYIEENDLPVNDLWSTLGRSGDCFCGCFGSPEETLDLEAAGCDKRADWLRNLESEVSEEIDGKEALWAWGALSEVEQRAEDNNDDLQMTLCSSCGAVPDGGRRE